MNQSRITPTRSGLQPRMTQPEPAPDPDTLYDAIARLTDQRDQAVEALRAISQHYPSPTSRAGSIARHTLRRIDA